ncbi:transposable element Tcb2 transposase [Trichonephila clavipes]|nr:transposable element Tcb2 transposase [Trichonephila clavipes]
MGDFKCAEKAGMHYVYGRANGEDLVARVSEATARVRQIPGIFERECQSLHRCMYHYWKNRWNAGILTITNRSVSNSECGPVCDLKTVAEVSKNGRCYPTTSIRRLNHAGLYARRPAVCIPLTSEHKRARLNWSLKHQHWSVGEWTNVMFSDESWFSLSSDSRRVTIWRERGTRFEPRNITKRHHFPSRGVMVWAGIMMDGHTDLHFFDTGSVTA